MVQRDSIAEAKVAEYAAILSDAYGLKKPLDMCWACSVVYANSVRDMNSRELAEFLQEGFRGFKTPRHVLDFIVDYLSSRREDAGDGGFNEAGALVGLFFILGDNWE